MVVSCALGSGLWDVVPLGSSRLLLLTLTLGLTSAGEQAQKSDDYRHICVYDDAGIVLLNLMMALGGGFLAWACEAWGEFAEHCHRRRCGSCGGRSRS